MTRTLVDNHKHPKERRTPARPQQRAEEHPQRLLRELLPAEEHDGHEVQRPIDREHPPEHLPEVRDMQTQARVDVRVDDRAGREVEAEGAQALGQRGLCEALGEDGVVLLGDALMKVLSG